MNRELMVLSCFACLSCLLISGCPVSPSGGHLPGEAETFGGIDFVWCPPGTYLMGASPLEAESEADERPQHSVTIEQGFWMSRYEITQKQWTDLMGSNPSLYQGLLAGSQNTDNRPVESVSWTDVQDFITALNAANAGLDFRLPNEAEWEYACRAGSISRFYWGNDPIYTRVTHFAWYSGNAAGQTHDVGGKLPNAWGLFDMSGNVWEWVQEWYHTDYSDGAYVIPERVFRGGSWSSQSSCRSAARNSDSPTYRAGNLGFRIIRNDS